MVHIRYHRYYLLCYLGPRLGRRIFSNKIAKIATIYILHQNAGPNRAIGQESDGICDVVVIER